MNEIGFCIDQNQSYLFRVKHGRVNGQSCWAAYERKGFLRKWVPILSTVANTLRDAEVFLANELQIRKRLSVVHDYDENMQPVGWRPYNQ